MKEENKDELFMRVAIKLAKLAAEHGNEPFGAVLVKDNEIVMESENQIHTRTNPTLHAELRLISEYCEQNQVTDLSAYTLYTSCEPCCMCSGAMVWSNLGKMVYSLSHDELAEIAGFNITLGSDEIFAKSPNRPQVKKQVLKEEAVEIYRAYFEKK